LLVEKSNYGTKSTCINFYLGENASGVGYRRDIIGSDIKVLGSQVTKKASAKEEFTREKIEKIQEYKAIIAIGDKYLVAAIHVDNPIDRQELYLHAKEQYLRAIKFKIEFGLDHPEDFVKIVDQKGDKYVLVTLEQAIGKIDEMYALDMADEFRRTSTTSFQS